MSQAVFRRIVFRRIPILGVASLAVLLFAAGVGTGSAEPEAGPDLDLARWQGKVVLLDFWASWCDPCRQSFPWMAEMSATYRERGLVVVAVNLDEDGDDAERFLSGRPGDFEHVRDPGGTLAERFGVTVMPSAILFDRDGRPAFRHEGFHLRKVGEYERHIVDLLEGRGPRTALDLDPGKRRGGGVRPWERGVLALPEMQLIADPLEIEFDDHVYFSKEASSGGRGFGGGGCGCN